MAALADIRAAIAANLTTSLEDIQISPYMLANPTPPGGHVFPAEVLYDQAMGRGLDEWHLTVQLFVALATDIGAQERLDAYLAASGSQSVKAAIESDRTLGGAASDVRVESSSGYHTYLKPDGVGVLGAEWTVRVLAPGND